MQTPMKKQDTNILTSNLMLRRVILHKTVSTHEKKNRKNTFYKTILFMVNHLMEEELDKPLY